MKKNSKKRFIKVTPTEIYECQLKNVEYSEARSDETNAFICDLVVRHKGEDYTFNCENDGKGGMTWISRNKSNMHIYTALEDFLKTQDDYIFAEYMKAHNYTMTNIPKMSLDKLIDYMFEDIFD